MSLKIGMDIRGFSQAIQAKKEQFQAASRPAAQAGAQVIYDQARINVPVSKDGAHFFYGSSYKKTGQKYGPFSPGNLRDAIYQVFSQDNSGPTRSTYHVSWNRLRAPYAAMVEFGTSKAPAKPFLRPAIINKRAEVSEAMKRTFIEKVTAA